MEFSEKTAIITGAASGMGLLTAQRLAEKGANVVITDVNGDAAEKACESICKKGGSAIGLNVDVREYAQVKNAVNTTIKKYGQIDILVNCAGGSATRVFNRTEGFADIDIGIIDWGLDVNLRGPVYLAHAVIGHMIAKKSGVIINVGSIDGATGSANAIEYSTAKSGVMYGLTKSLALYGAPYGIRVCCVSPGPVLTRPTMAKMKTPLGRAAMPGEVVDLILYLVSDKAAFVTGTNYLIDGGRNCGAGEYK